MLPPSVAATVLPLLRRICHVSSWIQSARLNALARLQSYLMRLQGASGRYDGVILIEIVRVEQVGRAIKVPTLVVITFLSIGLEILDTSRRDAAIVNKLRAEVECVNAGRIAGT